MLLGASLAEPSCSAAAVAELQEHSENQPLHQPQALTILLDSRCWV